MESEKLELGVGRLTLKVTIGDEFRALGALVPSWRWMVTAANSETKTLVPAFYIYLVIFCCNRPKALL